MLYFSQENDNKNGLIKRRGRFVISDRLTNKSNLYFITKAFDATQNLIQFLIVNHELLHGCYWSANSN